MDCHRTYSVFRTLCPNQPPIVGADVAAIQKALRIRGFYHGPINGTYDQATINAVQELQQAMDVYPNGVVDSALARTLRGDCFYIIDTGEIICEPPLIHIARAGETLFSIAARYNRLPQDVIAVNQHILDPNVVPVGTRVSVARRPLTGIGWMMGEGACDFHRKGERSCLYYNQDNQHRYSPPTLFTAESG